VGAGQGWKSTGLSILAITGGVCLLMSLIGDKITEIVFKRGKTTIQFKLDNKVQVDLEVTGLAGAAGIYSFVHNQLGNDRSSYEVKVKLQDDLVATVKKNAFNQRVDSDEVDKVLRSGSAAERVLVFGLLQADRDLATVERLHEGISNSKSGNEQYHALLATWTHWSIFRESDKELLCEYVRTAQYIKKDPDREKLAANILAA